MGAGEPPMPPPLDYGPPRDERELDAYGAIIRDAFLFPREPPTPTHAWKELVDGEGGVRIVRAGSDVLGGLARFELGQWFSGKLVPSNAIAAVAIAPQHRGRGAAAHLMKSLVGELHRDGVALSVLYPATHTLYRRAGYEFAGVNIDYRVATRGMDVPRSTAPALRVRPMVPEDEATVARLHRARVADVRGPFERNRHLWNGALRPDKRVFAYVFEHEGQAEGYVVMTRRPEPGGDFDLIVSDLVAVTGRAACAIVGFFADHRSVAPSVVFSGGVTEPVLGVMSEQSGVTVQKRREWFARVVDVPRALAAYGYPAGVRAELHLEVDDPLVPENQGRWLLTVEDGHAEIRRGGSGALVLPVSTLAPLSTGHVSPFDLRRMGKLSGEDDALRAAGALFGGSAPWMADRF